jgi:hypothetical protein
MEEIKIFKVRNLTDGPAIRLTPDARGKYQVIPYENGMILLDPIWRPREETLAADRITVDLFE